MTSLRGPGSNQYADKAPLPPQTPTSSATATAAGLAVHDPFSDAPQGPRIVAFHTTENDQWTPNPDMPLVHAAHDEWVAAEMGRATPLRLELPPVYDAPPLQDWEANDLHAHICQTRDVPIPETVLDSLGDDYEDEYDGTTLAPHSYAAALEAGYSIPYENTHEADGEVSYLCLAEHVRQVG